jgi:hypothetical protein
MDKENVSSLCEISLSTLFKNDKTFVAVVFIKVVPL